MNSTSAQKPVADVVAASAAHAHFAKAPVANLADLTGGQPILVIAPHPDDETLGCGGLIALAVRHGTPCTIVVMTDGARAHLNSQKYDAVARRDMREAELRAAALTLGLSSTDVVFLRQPDGFLPSHGPEALRLVASLGDLCERAGARRVFVTWAGDPHPDHAASAALAMQLARQRGDLSVFAYPIWGLTLDPSAKLSVPFAPAVRLEVRSVLTVKRCAVACFASQFDGVIDDDPEGFQLSPADIARFTGEFETFIHLGNGAQPFHPQLSSVPTAHFEALYQKSADPWEYVENGYEQGRFGATLKALPQARYSRACEIGCSIGVLTRKLADRCDSLLAIDCSEQAIAQAELRLSALPHATAHVMRVPEQLPDGDFDLIVLSEVLYFFSAADLARMAQFVARRLLPGGTCILVNFLGDTESPMGGDEAADRFKALLPSGFRADSQNRFDGFRIDVVAHEKLAEAVA